MAFFSLLIVGFPLAQQRGMRTVGKHPPDLPDVVYRTGWAIVIGINKYPGLPAQYQLNYAVADADAVAEMLQHKFGFPESNIIILKDEEATKNRILEAFFSLGDPEKVKENDCVLIYFSGHGQTVKLAEHRGGGRMGFLVPYDAEVDLSDEPNAMQYQRYCVGMDELERAARHIPAKHLLFIVDACYSGLVLKSSRGLNPKKVPKYLKKVAASPAQQMITAGTHEEESVERPDFGHGVFTYKMLQGLNNGIADWNDDGVITGSELGNYLRMTVIKMTDGEQTPTLAMEGDGEFIFMPQVEEEPGSVITEITELESKATLTVESSPEGAAVFVDEQKLGTTPCDIEIDMGIKREREVVVAVMKEGYEAKLARVKLAAGKQAKWTNISLEKLPEPESIPDVSPVISEPPSAVRVVSPIATGSTEIIGKDGVPMVLIPAGEFQMGAGAASHVVYLDAFYMDKYEVTNAQYKKFIDATGHRAATYLNYVGFDAPDQPVVGLNWDDAEAYCQWAGKRLPTEAEWEKAARGGLRGKKYPSGDEITHDDANYFSTGGRDKWMSAAPVGSFAPNGYGLYDVAGNVWEWCADWHDENYYSTSPKRNPKGPDSGKGRVLRGGSWSLYPDYLLVSKRYSRSPVYMGNDMGFRCAQNTNP